MATREADQVSLPRIHEAAAAQPRPAGLGTLYVEKEYDAQADEQELLWPAEGEYNARPYKVRASGLTTAANATGFVLAQSETEVTAAHADFQMAAKVLTPYVRREPLAKLRYWIGLPVLWLGDTAGVWSAAVMNGEVIYIALGQALAAGMSAVCGGLIGSELRDLRLAQSRRRDLNTLTEEELRYQHLLARREGGVGVVKLIGFLSVLVVILIALGVGTLRSSVDGEVAGLTFGLLAAATAIGSGLLGYSAADEVADLLATAAKRVQRAEQHHLKLAAAAAPRLRAESVEASESIQAEHQLRGQAAGKRMESLSWRVQRRAPYVLGHGFPTGEQGGVIGRRSRRGGAA
jgi:hypothetical protein